MEFLMDSDEEGSEDFMLGDGDDDEDDDEDDE